MKWGDNTSNSGGMAWKYVLDHQDWMHKYNPEYWTPQLDQAKKQISYFLWDW